MLLKEKLEYVRKAGQQASNRKGTLMDSKLWSMTKTITWRILALLTTTIVSFAILRSWSKSIYPAISSNLLKTLYYARVPMTK